jgi:hypothetical protein
MKQEGSRGIRNFLIFIGILVSLTIVQDIFKPISIKGVDGAFVKVELPEFNRENLFNSKYQQTASVFVKQNTSFCPDFIRLNNQLDYWFFNEVNSLFVLGKDKYIFDPNYVMARTGDDYIDVAEQKEKKKVIIESKEILDSLNIPILYCIAPNKANFYSEYLLEETPKAKRTNQLFFEEVFIEQDIAYINFDRFFEQKEKEEYPLIPIYGAHWSAYGAYIAGKEMFRKIEDVLGGKQLEIIVDSMEISKKARGRDDDYLESLNIITNWESPPMLYPHLSFKVVNKPNVLVISDSFFWNFYDLNIIQSGFSEFSEMWYYNKTAYNYKGDEIKSRKDFITFANIKDRDLIIVLSSDPSLKDFGYGFLEQLTGLYNK